MAPETMFKVISLLYCSVYAASIEDIGSYYFRIQSEWNVAFKKCQENDTRLPIVNVSVSGLQLADAIQWNPNDCFWIGAIYESITNNTYGTFPTVCCGTISKTSGRNCGNCEEEQQFVCESVPNTVAGLKLPDKPLTWTNACKYCSDAGIFLPSENNTIFLERVTASPSTSAWWTNGRRILNLLPKAAKRGDLPLCYCNAAIQNFQCSSNVLTYCLPYSGSNVGTTSFLELNMRSLDAYSTKMHATLTSISGESSNQKSEDTGSSNTLFQSVISSTFVHTGTFNSVKNDMGWKEAYQTCHANNSHLPQIDLLLQMKNTIDLSKCFWIEATYDSVDVNGFISQNFLYPTYCCGRAGLVEGMFVHECADCSEMSSYLCVQDFSIGTDFLKSSSNISTWAIARATCGPKGGLPDQNTTEFQHRMKIPRNVHWINELRALNISPVERNGKDSCAYWNKVKVEFGSCDQHGRHIASICIHDQTSINAVNVTTVQSQRTYQTTSVLQVEETSVYRDDREASQAKKESNPGIGPILGGTLGAFAVIIIVTIVIVILLKRRRMKNGNDVLVSSTTANSSKGKIKASPKTNDSYDTIFGGSLVLEQQRVTSNQMSTAPNEEPVIYAQPQKDKQTSRNLIDNTFNITQSTGEKENIGLYSMVRKSQKQQEKNSNLMKLEGLGKELGNGEYLENVYNTVSFHRPEFQDEQTVNMYDKANFRFEVLEVVSGNTYDDERVHRGESSNYNTTDVLNSTTDSTYDHLK